MNRINRACAVFACGALALVGGFASHAVAQTPTVKIAYETSDTHIKARSVAVFKTELERLSQGKIAVQLFPNASLMPSRQEVGAAIQGQVQAILPFVSFYEAVAPRVGIFTMPMLFRDYGHLERAANGSVGKAVYGDLEAKGLVPLAFWYETPTHIFTTRREVSTLDQLKGLKVRIYPSAALEGAIRSLGANPAVIAGSEVYLALQNGTVDAAVTTPSFAQSLKLTDSLKTMTRVNLVLGGYIFAMNKAFFDGLPTDLQGAVRQAAAKATEFNKQQITEEVTASEKAMVAAGVKIVDLTPQERERWVKLVQPVLEKQSEALAKLIAEVQSIPGS